MDGEVNNRAAVREAAEAAWVELSSDKTRVVQLGVIRDAAQAGVTNLGAVKKALMDVHGDELRNARV